MNYFPYKPEYDARYVKKVSMVSLSDDTRGIMAFDDVGKPLGVVLFDQFTDTACTAHISITNPMALRGLHVEAFNYAFKQLGKRMIIGIVAGNNAKALKLNAHFGFTEILRITDGYDVGVDQVVLQMLREDCKYIDKFKEAA